MIRLKPFVQNYAWGKRGKESEVALLCQAGQQENFTLASDQPYAELWMGTHSKGPSTIYGTNELLSIWLSKNTDFLGRKFIRTLAAKPGSGCGKPADVQLPFLFKVLSVNEALSIQVHPNKAQAEKLHSADPTNYPDNNHKPEMAIALTPFEVLCGFRPASEILRWFEEVEELSNLVGSESIDIFRKAVAKAATKANVDPSVKTALKTCFGRLMRQDKQKVQTSVKELTEERTGKPEPPFDLFIRLNKTYPGDIGCFAVFFLNYITLKPGEAIFLGPNEPHAYLYGDCMECMACSDNTIRAGLTPKFKDISNLIEMLTYSMKPASEIKYTPKFLQTDPHLTIYEPPVSEFMVHKIQVSECSYNLAALDVCSLMIVIHGKAVVQESSPPITLSRGFFVFVPADKKFALSIKECPLLMFRAFCALP